MVRHNRLCRSDLGTWCRKRPYILRFIVLLLLQVPILPAAILFLPQRNWQQPASPADRRSAASVLIRLTVLPTRVIMRNCVFTWPTARKLHHWPPAPPGHPSLPAIPWYTKT